MWLWRQTSWQNLNKVMSATFVAADYELYALAQDGRLWRYLTLPGGGWTPSGFFGSADKLAVGNAMDDFAADDIAFLFATDGNLKTWH